MKMKFVLIALVIAMSLTGCDWYCKKDHIFTFSYPNDLSQSEFRFDVDYSEVPESEIYIDAIYVLSIYNCSDKDELTIEIYTQFSSENEYHLDEIYKFLPGGSNTYEGELYYREMSNEWVDDKERNVSILIKGMGSNCFNGEINIKTVIMNSGFGKPTCPYGYEVD